MNIDTIIRAWKDPAFRAGLSSSERAELPANPAGIIELSDAELGRTVGGDDEGPARTFRRTICGSCNWLTLGCCGGPGSNL